VSKQLEDWGLIITQSEGIPTTGHLTDRRQRLGSTAAAGFRPGLLIPVAATDGESVGIDDRERALRHHPG